MIKIKINNFEFLVKSDLSVLEACKFVGIDIPRFCYHEMLSVSGNCRMCLVELEKSPKPVASCALPVTNNMQVYVDTPLVKKARENVLETLLLNHPLDCPICDQGGECDLQDQTKLFGGDFSRFFFLKRGVEDKNCGPLIKTIMTRCIHCTRCVRFGSEIAGIDFLGTLNRGGSTEIGGYIDLNFNSEISGNVIDLCPVGALTSKPYAFKARPWEIRSNESIDLTDSTGSNIYINFKESEVIRILPKNNIEINENLISDKARFSYDSFKTQRLQRIFIKILDNKGVINYKLTNWTDIFKQIDNLIYNGKSITFIIDDELDLESQNLLRILSNNYRNKLKFRSINNFSETKSNLFSNMSNKISDLKTVVSKICFLMSTNIRIESAILNTKIRTKHFDQNIKVLSFGIKSQSNIPLEFLNLNIDNAILLFEGKSLDLSNLLISFKNPILIFGESFKSRFKNLDTLIRFLKLTVPSIKILNIKKSSNSAGSEMFNVKSLNKKDLSVSDAIINLNVNENANILKLLKDYKGIIFSFSTHKSRLAQISNYIIPSSSFLEDDGIFLNLEYRPQKTLKTLSFTQDTRSLKSVLKSINIKNKNKKTFFLDFINELIEVSNLFSICENKFINSKNFLKINFTDKTSVSLYPLKSTIENFYMTNKFTQNSKTMIKCYKETLKNFKNF